MSLVQAGGATAETLRLSRVFFDFTHVSRSGGALLSGGRSAVAHPVRNPAQSSGQSRGSVWACLGRQAVLHAHAKPWGWHPTHHLGADDDYRPALVESRRDHFRSPPWESHLDVVQAVFHSGFLVSKLGLAMPFSKLDFAFFASTTDAARTWSVPPRDSARVAAVNAKRAAECPHGARQTNACSISRIVQK